MVPENFFQKIIISRHNLSLYVLHQAVTKSKLEFDLTRFRDFTLNFPGYQTQDDYSYQLLNPGMFTVTMAPEETIEGELIFMPTEVTEYCDFTLEGCFLSLKVFYKQNMLQFLNLIHKIKKKPQFWIKQFPCSRPTDILFKNEQVLDAG